MAFNAAGLGEKEIADHGDVVRHFEGFRGGESKSIWREYRTASL